jgi:hypothetical protein
MEGRRLKPRQRGPEQGRGEISETTNSGPEHPGALRGERADRDNRGKRQRYAPRNGSLWRDVVPKQHGNQGRENNDPNRVRLVREVVNKPEVFRF